MSDFSQRLVRVYLALVLICILSQASAYEISASPDEIIFEAKAKEKTCHSITIQADSHEVLINTLWSENESRNLDDFKYGASKFGLEVTAPKILTNNEDLTICSTTSDKMSYHGVVLIEDTSGRVGLGVWLTINPKAPNKPLSENEEQNVENLDYTKKTRPTITGNTITEKPSPLNLQTYLILSTFFSTLILGLLLILARRRRKNV